MITLIICFTLTIWFHALTHTVQGRIQDFKLGGAHLKKLRRAEGGAKIFGVFRVKNHDFTPKIIFFPILRGGGGAGCAPLPESAPAVILIFIILLTLISVPVIMAVFLYFCN